MPEALAVSLPEPQETPCLDAIATFFGVLGVRVDKDSLTVALPLAGPDLALDLLPQVFDRAGFVLRQSSSWSAVRDFPVCVRLKDGEFVVIVKREGDTFLVADQAVAQATDRRPVKSIQDRFGGLVLSATPSLDATLQKQADLRTTAHWFWSPLRSEWPRFGEVFAASLFANGLAVTISLFALLVYDRVIPNESIATLWVLAAGVFIAILLEATLRMCRAYTLDRAGRSIEHGMSRRLFDDLLGMRSDRQAAGPSTLVEMLRDIASVREFFTNAAVGVAADIPFAILFLGLIALIAPEAAMVVAIAGVVMVAPSFLLKNAMAKLTADMMGGSGAKGRLATEVAYHGEAIKLVRGERFFRAQWEDLTAVILDRSGRQRMMAAGLTFWATAVQQVAYISTVIVGVFLVFQGDFSIGSIIAVSILTSRTLSPITQLAGVLSRWHQSKASLEALDQIACAEQDRPADRIFARREILSGEITCRGIEFRYSKDDRQGLRIDRLSIASGDHVALLGANGSGKSTFLRLLSGLYLPQAGSVSVDGLSLDQLDPDDMRRNIGVLTQDVPLFKGSLRENLSFGDLSLSERSLLDAIEFVGLDGFLRRQPRGLDMQILDGGQGLSVGQRQCLGLARLYLRDPRIVILDEPTASLDQTSETRLIDGLTEWTKGRTCIMATHRLPILSLANRIVVMNGGNIALDGERDFVLAKIRKQKQTHVGRLSDAT